MARIRILITDDHAMVREGLARVLSEQPDMRVVAQAEDGEDACAAARTSDPHVVLLDMRMPGLGGVAAIKRLRAACPRARILVLSMYEDPQYVRAARAAGAHAYLGKRESAGQLLSLIRRLHAGELPGNEAGQLDGAQSDVVLSAREREIVERIVAGETSREMAEALGITKSSVDTYRARIFRKLGVDSRAALFARVAELEPVEPPQ
jgi:two-component system NarL family response regulator